MSRRASLPGADELFRPTGSPRRGAAAEREDKSPRSQGEKSTNLQVAEPAAAARKAPRHETKVTFYCTNADLTALDMARLTLRSDHGVGADRGKVVRTALSYVLEDFEARGEDSILLRRLQEEKG
ncbi:MAG TPA: hypothetical protein VEU29_07660 [Actinomycetota bacterium]|nr:hypothetical protein [Actinomycetota bacterium]